MASAFITGTAAPPGIRVYPGPQRAMARFVGVRALRLGAAAGVALGIYVYATAAGFRLIAPTPAQRAEVLTNLAASTGFKVLLGQAARITSAAGFVDWRVVGVAAIVGPVCWLIVTTRTLRGEESSGRWELVLACRTTPGRATASVLAGLGGGLLAMYLAVALLTLWCGRLPALQVGAGRALLFGVAVVAPAAEFLAIGALASQVMATRARAAALAAGTFGAAFLLRAAGDAAARAHFLVYVSPLGWVEQLHTLGRPQLAWLLPIAALIAACIGATLLIAARRDLGASLVADTDTAEPRLALLGSPIGIGVRLSWQATIRWLAVIVVAGVLYGALARSAGQAFATSGSLRQALRRPGPYGGVGAGQCGRAGLRRDHLPAARDPAHGLCRQRRRQAARRRGRGIPGQHRRAPGEPAVLAGGPVCPHARCHRRGRGAGRDGFLGRRRS